MAKADKTKTPNPDLTPYYNPKHGFISEFKPSIADNLLGLLGDSAPANVLKGVYEGLDYGLFGMLPDRNYLTPTAEENLGTFIGGLISPRTAINSAKGLVSGVRIGNKSYPTPVGKLIANTIEPESYTNKFGHLKRALTNPRVLYDAVVKDMPQYVPRVGLEDRIWAWRKKFGIDYAPNKDYDKMLNLNSNQRMIGLSTSDLPRSLKNIWNKFGKHTEDGAQYYHYKNPKDYFNQMQSEVGRGFGGVQKHNLFGSYKLNDLTKYKGNKQIIKHDYYDDWDFGLNRSLTNTLFGVSTDSELFASGTLGLLSQIYKNPTIAKNLIRRTKNNAPTTLQRIIGNALTRELKFKGTAKKVRDISIPTF
ncbi:hypothetical protein N9I45_00215 [bacterium]|nr:hypothetical protein [bacterium]